MVEPELIVAFEKRVDVLDENTSLNLMAGLVSGVFTIVYAYHYYKGGIVLHLVAALLFGGATTVAVRNVARNFDETENLRKAIAKLDPT